jgi:hypothetical protein
LRMASFTVIYSILTENFAEVGHSNSTQSWEFFKLEVVIYYLSPLILPLY